MSFKDIIKQGITSTQQFVGDNPLANAVVTQLTSEASDALYKKYLKEVIDLKASLLGKEESALNNPKPLPKPPTEPIVYSSVAAKEAEIAIEKYYKVTVPVHADLATKSVIANQAATDKNVKYQEKLKSVSTAYQVYKGVQEGAAWGRREIYTGIIVPRHKKKNKITEKDLIAKEVLSKEETTKYFSETIPEYKDYRVITKELQEEQKSISNSKTEEYYKTDEPTKNGESTNYELTNIKDKQNLLFQTAATGYGKATKDVEGKSAQEIRDQIIADNRKYRASKTGAEDSENQPTEEGAQLKNAGMGSNKETFPKPGQDVATHNGDVNKYLNQTVFKAVSSNNKTVNIFRGFLGPDGKPDPSTYFTPANPYSVKANEMIEQYRKQVPGSYRFFIEKLHGSSTDGKNYTKGLVKSGLTRLDLPNRMVFPTYIEAFNDSYDVSWSDYNFIGRSEAVYAYKATTRSLTLSFYLISDFSSELLNAAQDVIKEASIDTKQVAGSKLKTGGQNGAVNIETLKGQAKKQTDALNSQIKPSLTEKEKIGEIVRLLPDWGLGTLPIPGITPGTGEMTGFIQGQMSGTPEMLWTRLTFLAQLCYPWYRRDGKLKEQPIVRVRVGDFLDVVAKINGLSLDEYDQLDMDLNPSKVGAIPMGVKVTMNMTVIHESEANSNYTRFYHRLDFDKEAENYVPDAGNDYSMTGDSKLDVEAEKKLPAAKQQVELARKKFTAQVQQTARATSDLTGGAIDEKGKFDKKKLQVALQNSNDLLNIKGQMDALKMADKEAPTEIVNFVIEAAPQDNTSIGSFDAARKYEMLKSKLDPAQPQLEGIKGKAESLKGAVGKGAETGKKLFGDFGF